MPLTLVCVYYLSEIYIISDRVSDVASAAGPIVSSVSDAVSTTGLMVLSAL